MDINCAKCGEPWDTYHLLHDEVWETEAGQAILSHQYIHGPETLPQGIEPWESKLTPFWEAQFKALGWSFASHCIVAPIQCTCCCKDFERTEEVPSKYGLDLSEAYAAVADLLGDDIDGFISEFGE